VITNWSLIPTLFNNATTLVATASCSPARMSALLTPCFIKVTASLLAKTAHTLLKEIFFVLSQRKLS
jgi:hypothetical protein